MKKTAAAPSGSMTGCVSVPRFIGIYKCAGCGRQFRHSGHLNIPFCRRCRPKAIRGEFSHIKVIVNRKRLMKTGKMDR